MPAITSPQSTRSSRSRSSPYSLRSLSSSTSSSPTSPSSTSDAEIRRRLKLELYRCQKETQIIQSDVAQAKKDLEAAETARSAATANLNIARTAIEQFVNVRDNLLLCSVCQEVMKRPFTLIECSHSFCHGCLRNWFQTLVAKQLRWAEDVPVGLLDTPYTPIDIRKTCFPI
ncbi:hypothetical protein BJ138DRAFT_1116128 [Hygrophoropsis aurantiaca]|uniref:Uncharacterized protein n=1 Tax=Hygrophoropsis aurantiaca TaxID=72124 RepID=A0ACB8A5X4_9AGAM|nr:hypothetical protein BJ138DRAFT_1116128 [Hygrophoropsis aurantiaca]